MRTTWRVEFRMPHPVPGPTQWHPSGEGAQPYRKAMRTAKRLSLQGAKVRLIRTTVEIVPLTKASFAPF